MKTNRITNCQKFRAFASICLVAAFVAGSASAVAATDFHWRSSAPLILPKSDGEHAINAVKDPSISMRTVNITSS